MKEWLGSEGMAASEEKKEMSRNQERMLDLTPKIKLAILKIACPVEWERLHSKTWILECLCTHFIYLKVNEAAAQ